MVGYLAFAVRRNKFYLPQFHSSLLKFNNLLMNIVYLIVHANTEEDIHKRQKDLVFLSPGRRLDEPAEFPRRGDRCREGWLESTLES